MGRLLTTKPLEEGFVYMKLSNVSNSVTNDWDCQATRIYPYYNLKSIDSGKSIDKIYTSPPATQVGEENQFIDYYHSLRFQILESLIIRASKDKTQLVYFGKLQESGIELWATRYTGKDADGITQYEQTDQILNPIAHLRKLGENGYGIFSYPNHVSGGMGTKHAQGFTTLFFEDDRRSLDEQKQRWDIPRNLGIEPAIVVYSGGKSYHVNLGLTEDIGAARWQPLNRMLSIVMDSDISVNTLARAMRLPGVPRIGKDGQTREVEIVHQSDRRYDVDFVENALLSTGLFPYGLDEKRWQKYQSELNKKDGTHEEKREKALHWLTLCDEDLNAKFTHSNYDNITSGTGEHIPLKTVISRANRDNLNGVSTNRNSTGVGLAKDLFGSWEKLTSHGFRTDDPYTLFWEYCQKCNQTQWIEREWESIWKSATRGNPTPSLPDDHFWNCVNAYLYKENSHFSIPFKQKIVNKTNQFKKWLESQLKPKNKGLSKVDGTEYQDGLIQGLLNQGKSVLDARTTGSGKSYQVPKLVNPLGGKIWYITGDHRNPTVEAIANNFTDLHPRNQYGYYRDNNGKLKLAKFDTPKDKILSGSKGKCVNAGLFNQYYKLGYNPNQGGSENQICQSCPMLKTCRFTDGWYLNDRRETLENQYIRGHLESLPRADRDYSKDLIILDDFKFSPTKNLETDWGKLLLEQDRLRPHLSDAHRQEIDKLLQTLKPLFGDKTRYGLEHKTILESLKEVTLSDDLLDAIAALSLNLKEVFQTPNEINEKNKTVAAIFRKEAYQESQENLKNLPPNALIHLVKAVKGEAGVALQIVRGELTVTIDRRAEYSFLNEVGLLLVMDATATTDDLKMMGIDRPLDVVKGSDKVTDHDNLTVIAIHTKGLGQNPYKDSHGNLKGISDRAIKRLIGLDKALFDQYGYFPVIGPKPLKELFDHDGHWYKDNRGSNDFEGLPTLGFVGLPRPNLGAVKDEYLALMGTDDGFEEHYQNLIYKEILQGIGRPRANRYPDQQFTVLMIIPEGTDLNWLKDHGIKVINKSAFEITPEAGTETQATAYRVVQAARELLTQGVNVTQKAIAKIVGMTQQNISKVLRAKGLTVEILEQKLKNILPNENTTGPIKDSITASCITQELYKAFSDLFELPIEDLIEDAIVTIKTYGIDYFWEYLSNFPKALQGKYLIALRYLLQDEPEFFSDNPIT